MPDALGYHDADGGGDKSDESLRTTRVEVLAGNVEAGVE